MKKRLDDRYEELVDMTTPFEKRELREMGLENFFSFFERSRSRNRLRHTNIRIYNDRIDIEECVIKGYTLDSPQKIKTKTQFHNYSYKLKPTKNNRGSK